MTVKAPKKFPLLPVVIGVGAIALITTVILTMNTPTASEAGEFGTPTVTGDPLALASAGTDRALGLPIPEVVGADFAGNEVRIARDGRPKIIIFLAHWCSHCQAEVPVVQDWVEAGNLPDGLDLVGVATSTSSTRVNFPPSEWLAREGWSIPTIVDDTEYSVSIAYGVDAFPFWVFVNPDGLVAGRTSGELAPETITEIATTLLAMTPAG
jgi:thiol-disulfide isomerase/thioredoxin